MASIIENLYDTKEYHFPMIAITQEVTETMKKLDYQVNYNSKTKD